MIIFVNLKERNMADFPLLIYLKSDQIFNHLVRFLCAKVVQEIINTLIEKDISGKYF